MWFAFSKMLMILIVEQYSQQLLVSGLLILCRVHLLLWSCKAYLAHAWWDGGRGGSNNFTCCDDDLYMNEALLKLAHDYCECNFSNHPKRNRTPYCAHLLLRSKSPRHWLSRFIIDCCACMRHDVQASGSSSPSASSYATTQEIGRARLVMTTKWPSRTYKWSQPWMLQCLGWCWALVRILAQ
jgi:hypothetical protein